jgi:hypothetical protein
MDSKGILYKITYSHVYGTYKKLNMTMNNNDPKNRI